MATIPRDGFAPSSNQAFGLLSDGPHESHGTANTAGLSSIAEPPKWRPRPERVRQAIRAALAGISLAMILLVGVALAEGDQTYRVEGGDTLIAIADRFGYRTRELAAYNGIDDPNVLSIGQVIRLPAAKEDDRPSLSARSTRSEAPAASAHYVWPLQGPITTYFGERGALWRLGYHPGLDIGASIGTPIAACARGVVVEAESSGYNSGYGSYVKVDHGGGLISIYGHMSDVLANVGDSVEPGTIIGRVGMTGLTTGPHLHLELRENGSLRDPLSYLP